MNNFRIQTISDSKRDGLGVELYFEDTNDYQIVAQIMRSDRDKTLTITTYGFELDIRDIQRLIEFAQERLEPFEDNTPLSKANRLTKPSIANPL
ncbi:MAG: hypothetical protein AAGC44_08435 [Planctomycetota bacterium]